MTDFALLFDLDGTIADTDRLHHAAFAATLKPFGRELGIDEYRDRILGMPNVEIMPFLLPDAPERHAEVADAKEAAYREMLSERFEPIPGLPALLDWADAEGWATAVVTNAPRMNAERVLEATGLAERFEALIIGDECAKPKPDPEPYREGLRRLGVTPSRGVAFEDSRSGLRACRDAGLHSIGITTNLTAGQLLQAGAHQVISDYAAPGLREDLTLLKARAA